MTKKRLSVNHRSSFRFGSEDTTELEYYSFSEFDTLPDRPGWYCWFYVPADYEQVNLNFFNYAFLDVKAQSIFGVKFEGILRLKDRDKSPEMTQKQFELLKSTIIAFSPPLYIGIAKNLKTRLHTHKKQLEDYYYSGVSEANPVINEGQLDSEVESSYFASRVAKEMRVNNIDMTELCVKCVTTKDPADLPVVESVLNKMFTPPYGRR